MLRRAFERSVAALGRAGCTLESSAAAFGQREWRPAIEMAQQESQRGFVSSVSRPLSREALMGESSWASSVFTRTNTSESGMKVYNPTTPGFRGRIITDRKGLWKGKPFKGLTTGKKSISGRNNGGRITVRFRGGGHKRLYRFIDFKRPALPEGIAGEVQRIEYDPNRTARIALVKYQGQEEAQQPDAYAYIIASEGMAAGSQVTSGPLAPIKPGNTLMLKDIPAGTMIHNIELRPGKGGQMVRSAGTSAVLVKKGDDGYALVKLPSGEQRLVRSHCSATIGVVSNAPHQNRKLGKAGASRWLGRRPHNRGISMNPVDHPLGGGRGKSKSKKHPVSPTGLNAKGKKTRSNPQTDKFIRTSRHLAKQRK